MPVKRKFQFGNENAQVVDLFCGIGGLTHGFVLEGFDVVAGVDADETCTHAYEANNGAKFIHKDIGSVKPEDILRLYNKGKVKILVGCAPCQDFSEYNKKKSNADEYKLLDYFAGLIIGVQPDIVSMENVPALQDHRVYAEFRSVLVEQGYHVQTDVVFCPDYGIPQTRKRLVLLASKLGPISLVEKTHSSHEYPKVRDVIGNLKPIGAGEVDDWDPIHRASNLSPLNKQRIQSTPEGGSWSDWPDELKLKCHLKDSGKSYGSVYGRIRYDDVGPTITTQFHGLGNGRFGHPEQNRALSLREGALLQTFPEDYNFVAADGKVVISQLARHIGNAVPVRLGQIVAQSIKKHLETI